MPQPNLQPWIQAGYELFAREGPKGLKIEVIARQVQKNKSSFYHLFADLEIFTNQLLEQHLCRASDIARQEAACNNIVPELITLLAEVKTDLLFSRQLRINRSVPAYEACFGQANQLVQEGFILLWAKETGLEGKNRLAAELLEFALENFYLRITEENLSYEWLLNYFGQLKGVLSELKKT